MTFDLGGFMAAPSTANSLTNAAASEPATSSAVHRDCLQALRKLGGWRSLAEVEAASGWTSTRFALRAAAEAGEIQRQRSGPRNLYATLDEPTPCPVAPLGVTGQVLAALAEGPATIAQLRERTGLSKASISWAVDGLRDRIGATLGEATRGKRPLIYSLAGPTVRVMAADEVIALAMAEQPTREWTLVELAAATGLHVSTCHRVLCPQLSQGKVKRRLEWCRGISRRHIWRLA